MSKFVSLALVVCLVFVASGLAPQPLAQTPSTVPSPAAATTPKAAPKDVSALLAPIREGHDMPGMVCAVVTSDALVASGATGLRKRGSPEEITVSDRMHLGSCTKSMTATLCAMLVVESKLAWDMKVVDAFPELAGKIHPDWKDATLEMLLTNHGGAPANLDAGGLWSKLWSHAGTPREQRMALVEGVLSRAPEAKPGTKFIYSNAGFSIAGVMAERASNMSYEELLRKRLFVPLGMDSAGFGAPGTLGKIDEPRGHRENKKAVEVGPGSDNPVAITPAGRVHCSIVDWGKYVALHLRGEKDKDDGLKHLARGAVFTKLHTPYGKDDARYAMGWLVTDRAWGGRVLTHSGSNTMWYCVAWLAPEKDFAVLVATNQGGDEAVKACDEAAAALIADHTAKPAGEAVGAKDAPAKAAGGKKDE